MFRSKSTAASMQEIAFLLHEMHENLAWLQVYETPTQLRCLKRASSSAAKAVRRMQQVSDENTHAQLIRVALRLTNLLITEMEIVERTIRQRPASAAAEISLMQPHIVAISSVKDDLYGIAF